VSAPADLPAVLGPEVERGESPGRVAWRRLRRNPMAMGSLVFLVVIVAASLAAPLIAPYSYEEQDLLLGAAPPSAAHWLGTDFLGRDLLTRMLHGGRMSFAVGFAATLVSLVIGVAWGALAGYVGGRLDALMMRMVDILYALPFTLFVILLLTLFGRNVVLLFFAIGAVEWLTMARIVRGQVMALRKQEFVEACRTMGFSTRRIVFHHLVPNVVGPVIVYTTLTVPAVMLLEAFLSFLGLGVQPPASSWGILIKDGADKMEEYPWLLLFPGLLFSSTLFALNFLGDGLRDALDPKTSRD
jgi:oligopeptide transport system permease protein